MYLVNREINAAPGDHHRTSRQHKSEKQIDMTTEQRQQHLGLASFREPSSNSHHVHLDNHPYRDSELYQFRAPQKHHSNPGLPLNPEISPAGTHAEVQDRREVISQHVSQSESRASPSLYRGHGPYTAHYPCSCNECVRYYWHNYHYCHTIINGQWAIPNGPSPYCPVLRRCVSSEPRQNVSWTTPNDVPVPDEKKEEPLRQDMNFDVCGDASDANDQEVEMITSRQMSRNTRPYEHRRPQKRRRRRRSEHMPTHPYVQHPHMNIAHAQQYAYQPYANPYSRVHPHQLYPFFRVKPSHTMYHDGYALHHARSRKRKHVYDEFLLRPRKDYIIHADRSESPFSDITASPTPSLDGFDIPEIERLCRNEKDSLVIRTDAPVLDINISMDINMPRIERHSATKKRGHFNFDDNEETVPVRIVSPTKPKSKDDNCSEELKIWGEKKDRSGEFATISRSSSEQ